MKEAININQGVGERNERFLKEETKEKKES